MVAPARTRPALAARSLVAHALALGLFLLVVTAVVGTGASFSADEGAALVQTDHLADGHGWLLDHPMPEVDPEGAAFPFELSVTADGGFATFAKHPVYPLVLTPWYRLAGPTGAVLVSVAGALAAAVVAALLARRLAPGTEVATLWVVGGASPLLFDSQLVIAHTVGAALAGLAALAVVAALEDRRPALLAPAALAAVGAGLFRNEAVLLALALAAAVAGWALLRRDRLAAVAAVVIGGAGLATTFLDQALATALVGGADPPRGGLGSGGGLTALVSGRVDGAVTTLLTPSYTQASAGALLVALAALTTVGAAVVVRRNRADERGLLTVLVAIGAGAAVLRLVVATPSPIPGLLVAFPLLSAGLCLVRRSTVPPGAARLLTAATGLFALGVVATQYASGGSGEWGGRYFAVALPLIVPVVVLVLRTTAEGLEPRDARRWLGGLATVSAAFAALAVLSLAHLHDLTEAVVDDVVAAVADVDPGDGGPPVVVTTAGALPRLAWRDVPEARWLRTEEDDPAQLTDLTARLAAAGVERFVLVTDDPGRDADAAAEALDGIDATGAPRPVPSSGWSVVVVTTR